MFGDNATPIALSTDVVAPDGSSGPTTEKLQWDSLGVSNANDYCFFNVDSLLSAGNNKWAGSRHWKFAANKRKEASASGAVAVSKASKTVKERILIDFGDEKPPAMTLFAPPAPPKRQTKSSSGVPNTMYTDAAINKQQLDAGAYLLPEDSKIQLHDLCRLFLRPNMIAPPPSMLAMFQPKGDDTSSSSNKYMSVAAGTTANDMIWGVLTKKNVSLSIDDDDCGPSHADGNYMTEGGDIMYHNNALEEDDGDDYGGGSYGDDGGGDDNADDLISDLTASLASGLAINSNHLVQAKRTVGKINVG